MRAPEIYSIDNVRFSYGPWKWPFAVERRAEIDAHFAARRDKTPDLWNGRVLLAGSHEIDGETLRGSFFETDFASFIAWRDWGFPDPSIWNCFAMGAIRSSDGAYLLGEMGVHTSSAGNIYFPAGTPDPSDVVGDVVDLEGSVLREVHEETGLTRADFEAVPGWTAVFVGPRIALMKHLQAKADAITLRANILRSISRQAKPELVDIHIVRSDGDFSTRMPQFMIDFLRHALAR
jgi:hypothetical protein